jgi:uncharacterized repeat protein (TIGR01451 family)
MYPDVPDGGGGQLVTHTPFQLNIANDGHGNGDNTAYSVQLVVAVSDLSLLDAVTLTDGGAIAVTLAEPDFSVGTPEFPCDGRPMPPHGIYPAPFTLVELGDLEPGTEVSLTVDFAGLEGLEIHFDAFGEGVKNNGGCRDVSSPFGHDVTALVTDDGQGPPPPPPECELDIDKTSDVDAVEIGDEVVFTITATELSGCELTTVSITDFIPFVPDGDDDVPAFSIVGTDPSAAISDTEVVWDLGTLTAGGSAVVTMTVLFDQPAADGHVVVNSACAISDQTEEVCDAAEVTVGEVGEAAESIGGPGFWCRQFRATLDDLANAQFTREQLEGWRDLINDQSIVFPVLWDTTTLEGIRELLCRPNHLDTAAERLMRHLMTLWLNIVSERLDPALTLGELCDSSEPLPDGADPAWTVEYVLGEAEAALDTGADDDVLLFWKDVIDYINNSNTPDDCGRGRLIRGGPRRLMP